MRFHLQSETKIIFLIMYLNFINLESQLFAIQQDGIFLKQNSEQFKLKAEQQLEGKKNLQEVQVYKLFLESQSSMILLNSLACSIIGACPHLGTQFSSEFGNSL